MRLELLQDFIVAASERNLRLAADKLGVPASTLSRHITQLEQEVGAVLLIRGSDGTSLTHAGATYLEEANGILRQLQRAGEVARRIESAEETHLRLGHTDSAGSEIVVAAVSSFNRERPAVRIHLTEAPTTELIEGLTGGRLDVALLHPPVHLAQIEEEHLLNEALALIVPVNHRFASSGGVFLEDVNNEPFALPRRSADPGAYDRIVNACRRAGFTPQVVHEANTSETSIQLVAAGICVSLLPRAAIVHHRYEIKVVPLWTRIQLPVHLAWDRQNGDTTVSQVLDHLRVATARCYVEASNSSWLNL